MVLGATDRAPGNETKGERALDMNTPGFEPGSHWSEVECSHRARTLAGLQSEGSIFTSSKHRSTGVLCRTQSSGRMSVWQAYYSNIAAKVKHASHSV